MKILEIKSLKQKMILTLVILIICNFIFPCYSQATFGGKLIEPVKDLAAGFGDAFINLLQYIMLPGSPRAVSEISLAKLYAKYMQDHPDQYADIHTWIASLDASVGTELRHWPLLRNLADEDYYGGQVIPLIVYSPAAIFSNLVPALDINFIHPQVWFRGGSVTWEIENIEDTIEWHTGIFTIPNLDIIKVKCSFERESAPTSANDQYSDNIAYQLQGTIATWYVALRNIGIVLMLSILVYIAIRIIISSTAGENAKYREMLRDWLIAMCILFFMHYGMAFLLKSAQIVTDMLTGSSANILEELEVSGQRIDINGDEMMNNARSLAEFYPAEVLEESDSTDAHNNSNNENNSDESENEEEEEDTGDEDFVMEFGYTLIYLILVWYTLIFTWKYLKRFVYLAFLTMIAPLVALTYPIDKIKDGSAQAFNMWTKEYIFNVLLQPMHLILYTILITSAQNFAKNNLIYTIVALGFLLEAEKLFRALFGFDKGPIKGGGLASTFTAAAAFGTVTGLASKGVNGLLGIGKSLGGNGNSGNSSNSETNNKIRQADSTSNTSLADAFGDDDANGVRMINGNNESSSDDLPRGTFTPDFTPDDYNNYLSSSDDLPRGTFSPDFTPDDYYNNSTNNNGVQSQQPVTGSSSSTNPIRINNPSTNSRVNVSLNTGKRIVRGIGSVVGHGALRGLQGGGRLVLKAAPRVAKAAVTTGLTAAGATVGLAAGIASDGTGEILKQTAAGGAAGAVLGKGATNVIGQGGKAIGQGGKAIRQGAKNIRDDFQKGYHGSDYYDKVINAKMDKKWKEDKEVQEHFKRQYKDEWKKKLDQGVELRKAGITDQKDIDTALKLMGKHSDLKTNQAAAIMHFRNNTAKANVDMGNTEELTGIAINSGLRRDQAQRVAELTQETMKIRK